MANSSNLNAVSYNWNGSIGVGSVASGSFITPTPVDGAITVTQVSSISPHQHISVGDQGDHVAIAFPVSQSVTAEVSMTMGRQPTRDEINTLFRDRFRCDASEWSTVMDTFGGVRFVVARGGLRLSVYVPGQSLLSTPPLSALSNVPEIKQCTKEENPVLVILDPTIVPKRKFSFE